MYLRQIVIRKDKLKQIIQTYLAKVNCYKRTNIPFYKITYFLVKISIYNFEHLFPTLSTKFNSNFIQHFFKRNATITNFRIRICASSSISDMVATIITNFIVISCLRDKTDGTVPWLIDKEILCNFPVYFIDSIHRK